MMVRAGLLSDEQLAAVQATSAERKLSFVEALLSHSFADEDSVVGFLHSKLMIPKVGASILDGVDRSALDRIPGELAARHAVLPISSDETGNLTLAMVDPTDMKAVDAISAHTGAYLVRAVAPLRVIRSSIAHHYGIPAPTLPSLQATKPATAATPAAVIPGGSAPVPGASQSRAAPAAVISVPTVTPPIVTPPTVGAPSNGAQAPVVPTPPVVEPPQPGVVTAPSASRPSAPSGAAIRPSAVLMPGAPRPAAVLPAAAFAPSPYGIPAQPSAPVVAPTVSAPAPAPVPSASPSATVPVPSASPPGNATQPFGSSSLAAALAATPAAATAPASTATQPAGAAGLSAPAAAAAPASSASSAAGNVTQPFASSSITATMPAAPVSAASSTPANAAASLAPPAASAATTVNSAPVPSASSTPPAVEAASGQTVPVFSGSMATLRPAEEVDTSRGRTEPGSESAADTLAGAARNADDLDIPLDDLENDRGSSEPEAATGEPTFDAAKTQTWIPPSFTAANEIIPLSPEAFHRLLPRFATVKSRDEITDLLLDFLAEGFSRVIMFVHVKGEIRGRDARGEDLLVEAVRQIRIPAGGPSVFSGVIERRTPYFGSMRTDTPIDAAFFSALGGVEGVILVLPVLLREKVPLIVFASGSSNPVDPRSLHELTHEVAAALERIIVLEKVRGK
ncbi:hypothetical protein [Nannocystis punicea]|uniref:Type II secretion system protein GspE N-terminal domain-containing protein n=1 Tax=Nannocystis punicea TaxID=2995304 RepID=A0ABY7HHX3_9BACT|nr:hypothetical protein [Nannocystis poenicansa]WAS98936.1 hypothetical protein O0S08_22625 [Nannocystis poenicansa]